MDAAFREEWGRVVATLIRTTGDWDLAEECAQDAFAMALQRWPSDGVPARPGAWLTTAARNRAIDVLRRRAVGAAKLREVAALAPADSGSPPETDHSGVPDDRLRLMFTCCHPALSLEARVALTLRTLAGLTTAEIARAFLASEPTMAKRLVRAKQKIQHAGIPYRVPPAHLLPERVPGVLGVLYLLFNEGYCGFGRRGPGPAEFERRGDQAGPGAGPADAFGTGDGGPAGADAVARRAAFVAAGRCGDLVTLEDQDRSVWDAASIGEGVAVLEAALRRGRPGPYQIQAAIAACHATAPAADLTDWAQIALLYERLLSFLPTPVVELNHAVAVGMAAGPAAGLELVASLEASGALAGYHLLPATRADFLRRLGRSAEAAVAYAEALELTSTDAERRYLARRLAEARGETAAESAGSDGQG